MSNSTRASGSQSPGNELPGPSEARRRTQNDNQRNTPNENYVFSLSISPRELDSRHQRSSETSRDRQTPASPRVRFADSPREPEYQRRYPSAYASRNRSPPPAYRSSRHSHRSHNQSPMIDTSNRGEWGFHGRDSLDHRYARRPPPRRLHEVADASYDLPVGGTMSIRNYASEPPPYSSYGNEPPRVSRDGYIRTSRRSSKSGTVKFVEKLLCGMGFSKPGSSKRSRSRSQRHRNGHRRYATDGDMHDDYREHSRYDSSEEQASSRHRNMPTRQRQRRSSRSRRDEYNDDYSGTSPLTRRALPDRQGRPYRRYQDEPPSPRRHQNQEIPIAVSMPPTTRSALLEIAASLRRQPTRDQHEEPAPASPGRQRDEDEHGEDTPQPPAAENVAPSPGPRVMNNFVMVDLAQAMELASLSERRHRNQRGSAEDSRR